MLPTSYMYKVTHDKYGEGYALAITIIDEIPHIKVSFDCETKVFPYPDVFILNHMVCHDTDFADEINDDIKRYYQRKKAANPSPRIKYGTLMHEESAQSIYINLCAMFNWDISLKGRFYKMKMLYAADATPEHYGVVFFVHNSLWEGFNDQHQWYNYIQGDLIHEIWFQVNDYLHDMSPRVSFVKTKEGYVFFGVYMPISISKQMIHGEQRYVKTYKQIARNYEP